MTQEAVCVNSGRIERARYSGNDIMVCHAQMWNRETHF